MTSIFQQRTQVDYGKAMVRYSASKWDTETKMIYLMGRSPIKNHNNFKDTEEWQTFLASKNASVTAPLDQLSAIASEELVSRIVDAEMIERIADSIVVIVEANPDRVFSSVRVASPFPINPEATNNTFAPALAAAVATRLGGMLEQSLEERGRGTGGLKVLRDLDPNESDRDKGILNIVDNQRGSTSNPNPGEEVDLYMQRLIRQPVYSGDVDTNAIYVPVDDFLVSQTTMVGLMNYIAANGAVTTPAITGFKLFSGTEILAPQRETLDILEMAIRDMEIGVEATAGEKPLRTGLNDILNRMGLNIDFDDLPRATLSNIELLFLAGYFADGDNPEHLVAFEKALTAVGGTLDEARGNSAYDIFNSEPGSISGLETIARQAMVERQLMADRGSMRFQSLVESGRVKDYYE